MKKSRPWSWRRWLKRAAWSLLLLVLIGVALVAYANFAAVAASQGRLYDDARDLPPRRVALVFGCDDKIDGRDNLYFRYRIDAAVSLWKAGKVECVIVSGDNSSKYYNEPEAMRLALVSHGVPNNRIVSDYAGLRTLDSVVRAKEVFGVTNLIFVTQRFQNERAIYLAEANGIDAVGFNARDVPGSGGYKTRLREVGARVKMWLDVRFLATRPKHLGEKIELPASRL